MKTGNNDAHLLSALRTASRSLTADRRPDLDTALQNIVTVAVDTIEPAAGGGISRTAEGTVRSAYGTDEDVHNLDRLQSTLGQGPCISAATRGPRDGVIYARDLMGARDRDQWPSFAPQAVALGYRSLLSMQLSSAEGHESALNPYARDATAFSDAEVTLATVFSMQAAILLHGVSNAVNLQRALEGRDLIGQAKGVLIERFRISDVEAFQMLVEASKTTSVTLVDVARWLLGDAQRATTGPISTPPRS